MDNYRKREVFRHQIIGLHKVLHTVAKVTQGVSTMVQKLQEPWLQYQDLKEEWQLIEEQDHLPNRLGPTITLTMRNNRTQFHGETTLTFQSSIQTQPRKGCTIAMQTIWTTEIILEAYLANCLTTQRLLAVNILNRLWWRKGIRIRVMRLSTRRQSI